MSHENAPNIKFSYASLLVWNDGNSRNQTLTIGFFSEWTYGILARESGSLHVQSVVDKRCEYKYEVIDILSIWAITSKHTI